MSVCKILLIKIFGKKKVKVREIVISIVQIITQVSHAG